MSRNPSKAIPFWLSSGVLAIAVLSLLIVSLRVLQTRTPETVKQQQSVLEEKFIALSSERDVISAHFFRTLNPLVKYVQGSVVWSLKEQIVILQLLNLPESGVDEQYELWIYDLIRDAKVRVLGGAFKKSASDPDNFLIELTPELPVAQPYKFELLLKRGGRNQNLPLLLAQP